MVAGDHRVHSHLSQNPNLCFSLEEVEDRGALEVVAAVQVENAARLPALLLEDVGDTSCATVGPHALFQAHLLVRVHRHHVVGEEAAVDVSGV